MNWVASRHRCQFCLDVFAVAPKVLRLWSVPSPSSGAGAVKFQSAADPAIGITPGEQCIDLRLCAVYAAAPSSALSVDAVDLPVKRR
jgi:hypothetical protein